MGGVIGLNLVVGGVIRLNNNCLPGNGRCHQVEPGSGRRHPVKQHTTPW